MKTMTTTKALALGAALAACAALGACGDKSRSTQAAAVSSPGAAAPTTGDSSGAGGPCTSYKAGEQGVIRTFCTGKGVAKVTVGGKTYSVSGGECETQMGMRAFNAGVVTGTEHPTPLPDYVGMTVMSETGEAFENAVLPLHLGGKDMIVRPNKGTYTPAGGTFEGTVMGSGEKVMGSFTC